MSLGLLIVDDEENIIRSLYRVFHNLHYRIFTASSGAEGIEHLKTQDIAIVISDMCMPNMDGVEFLQHVAKQWPEVIRIVLTGYADAQDTINVINTGDIFRYINKPWDQGELLAAVAEAEKTYQKKWHEKNKFDVAVEERLQAEKLTEAKSRFLATMSHEIRSPLNSIIAMNALLLNSELNNEQRELAKIAHDGGQALLALVNDILDFSKIEAGRLQLNQEWFNIIKLIESTVELITTQAINKSIELSTIISPDAPDLLFGDKDRVRQILINILSNAVKFTEKGGVVVRISPGEKGVNISVEDTGIGIPIDRQETIFDEFTQVDNSDSRSYGGTGLGLSICKQLVRMMDGDITLSSQESAGSCFRFSLPIESKCSYPSKDISPKNHLVSVDSHNSVLVDALKEQLSLFGYDVVSINDISRNTNQYNKFSFIVDLSDINKSLHEYKNIFNQSLAGNEVLSSESWVMVGLIPNDGLSHLGDFKSRGFTNLLRKPVRLKNLLRYLNEGGSSAHEEEVPAIKAITPKNESEFENSSIPILLVEDSPSNQAVVKAILNNKGYQIDIANNGKEAVEKAEVYSYKIILMDLAMPVMDGLEATRHIRSSKGLNQQTTIIAMTANAFAEDRERCVDAGMNDYISKPIDANQFLACLNQWRGSVEADDKCHFFDVGILRQLVKDTSEEALCKILSLFVDESKKRIPRMHTFYRQQSWQQLGDEAHTLKSGAGNFGAIQLQRAAEIIEVAVREGNYSTINQEMLTLDELLEDTIQELKQYSQLQFGL